MQSTNDIVCIYGDICVSEGAGMSKLKKSFLVTRHRSVLTHFGGSEVCAEIFLVMSPDSVESIYLCVLTEDVGSIGKFLKSTRRRSMIKSYQGPQVGHVV